MFTLWRKIFARKKYHADFVAPLKKIVDDLKNHVKAQQEHQRELDLEALRIKREKDFSQAEVEKSTKSIEKISELI